MLEVCNGHHNTLSQGIGDFEDGLDACGTIALWDDQYRIETTTVQWKRSSTSLTEASMRCQSTPGLKSQNHRGCSSLKRSWKKDLSLS